MESYSTKQGGRIGYLAQTVFAAFDKGCRSYVGPPIQICCCYNGNQIWPQIAWGKALFFRRRSLNALSEPLLGWVLEHVEGSKNWLLCRFLHKKVKRKVFHLSRQLSQWAISSVTLLAPKSNCSNLSLWGGGYTTWRSRLGMVQGFRIADPRMCCISLPKQRYWPALNSRLNSLVRGVFQV